MSHDYDDLPELVLSPIAMPDDEIVRSAMCVCVRKQASLPRFAACVYVASNFFHTSRDMVVPRMHPNPKFHNQATPEPDRQDAS